MILALLVAAVLGIVSVSQAAAGTGPGDALIPTGGSDTLGAHASLWYRFDYGGDKSKITILLDSLNADGLAFAVYTPDNIAAWQSGDKLTPIGVGGGDPKHALVWEGRFNRAGTYFVVVRNEAEGTRTYQLSVSGDAVTTVRVVIPTATPIPNPFATPVPVGQAGGSGKIVLQDMRGGTIYTVNPDGSGLTPITTGFDPAWSPDGKQIAFARQGPGAGIHVINADGSNEHLVAGADEVRSPAWSPDGNRIVYSTIAQVKQGETICFRGRCFTFDDTVLWRLREVTLADGSVRDVFSPKEGAQSPTYNPDNNTIAFVGGGLGLMLTTSDNSIDPYIIAGDERITSQRYSPLRVTAPVYSPDGKQFVFMVMQNPAWQVTVANADGSNVHLLTRIDPLNFVNPNNVAPVWSPDGKTILFLSNRNAKWEFFAINADGTGLRQVLKNVSDRVVINYTYNADRMFSWR